MKDQWSLGSIAADGTHLEFIVSKLPCRIGRSKESDLLIANPGLSHRAPRIAGNTLFGNARPKGTFSEKLFTSLTQLRDFASRLAQLGIRFAYDNFGSGQSRLVELADVPAHFVKLGMSLLRGLLKASEPKKKVVRDLAHMLLTAGSVPLAEGVEDEEEAQICIQMGFQLIQGYPTGRSIPADSL